MRSLSSLKRHTLPDLEGRSGSVLGIVLVFIMVMLVMAIAVIEMGSQDAALAINDVQRAEALFIAESGIERAQTWLEAQDMPPEGTETLYPFGVDAIDLGGGTYDVCIKPDPLNLTLNPKIYTIVSVATVDDHTRCVEVDISPSLFSDFLYFTDREHEPGLGNPLWFISPDVIDGPLFTNDQISIMGDPTFISSVSSAWGGPDDGVASHEPKFLYYNGDEHDHIESAAGSNAPYDNPTFGDGYVLGDTEVEYPTHALAFDLKELAQDGGISVAGTYEIELGRTDEVTGEVLTGYVSYRKAGKELWNDVPIDSFNGVFYVNGSFSVSGVVDGQLTLVTNGSIFIDGDITYAASDANGPTEDCDDLLGIIAGTDINVEWNEANSNDCVIHAAMMGLDNCFRADSWNVGDPRGTLTVWGSIIQSYRGSVGTGYLLEDGSIVILTGYEKDYHYDWRLQDQAPPGFYRFMGTGTYERLAWREVTADA